MDPRDEADDYGDDAAVGGDDDPFSDLERVSDEEEEEDDDGEDLFENQEMCALSLSPSALEEGNEIAIWHPCCPPSPSPHQPPPPIPLALTSSRASSPPFAAIRAGITVRWRTSISTKRTGSRSRPRTTTRRRSSRRGSARKRSSRSETRGKVSGRG